MAPRLISLSLVFPCRWLTPLLLATLLWPSPAAIAQTPNPTPTWRTPEPTPTASPDQSTDPTHWLSVGLRHLDQAEYEAAAMALQQGLTLAEQQQDQVSAQFILSMLGIAYTNLGQADAATAAYQQALAIAQSLHDVNSIISLQMGLGSTYLQRGDYEAARAVYAQVLPLVEAQNDPVTTIHILNNMAYLDGLQSRWAEAIARQQTALAIARALPNAELEGQVLNSLGSLYDNLGEYDRALEVLNQALTVNVADPDRYSITLNNIAAVYIHQGNLDQAKTALTTALEQARATGDRRVEGTALSNLAYLDDAAANYPQALAQYEAALAIRREVGDRPGEAVTLNNIADIHTVLGDYTMAATTFAAALAIAVELGDVHAAAGTLNNLGQLYTRQSQYDRAIASYTQALAVQTEIGDRDGLSTTLNNLAGTYVEQGQYAVGLATYEQALTVIRALGNPRKEVMTQSNMGWVYAQLGQQERALALYTTALTQQRQLGGRAEELTILNNMGNAYFALDRYPAALAVTAEALAVSQAIGDRPGQVIILNNRGAIYEALADYEQAIADYEQALALGETLGDHAGTGVVLNNLGRIHLKQGETTTALAYLERAVALQTEVGYAVGTNTSLTNLGRAYWETGRYAAANETLLRAIAGWEALRPGLADADKVSLFENQAITYRYLQRSLVAAGQIETALEIAERGRARAFVELLSSRLPTSTQATLALDLSVTAPTFAEIQAIARDHHATLVTYTVIEAGDTPQLFIWVIKPTGELGFQAVDLPTLDALRGPTDGDGFFRGQIAATRGALGLDRSITVAAIPADRDRSDSDSGLPTSPLKTLYDLLIAPIAADLPTNPDDRVIFIPQGQLLTLPFAALQAPDGSYLIEHHTILTAPSIQVLQLTAQQRQRLASAAGRPDTALVVGNPTMPVLPSLPDTPAPLLLPLPGAEQEARTIAALLGTTPLLGDRATESAVVQQLPAARIIHLATHGLLDYGSPGDSWVRDLPGAIALAPAPTGMLSPATDGLLTAREILALQLQADLVVLSACDTGRGTITEDGVLGLSRSLLTAGVPSVMVSLWAVPDTPTSALMVEFYRQYQAQPDKARALRQAMLSTMRQYPNPRDWAAFTLVGEAD